MAGAGNYNILVGNNTVVTTVANTSSAVTDFLNQLQSSLSSLHSKVVGVDVEWNANSKVSVLQLFHGNRCLIIQMLYLDCIPRSLENFLADKSITFVGVSIDHELANLHNDYGIMCNSGIELGHLADRVCLEKVAKLDFSGWRSVELAGIFVGFSAENRKHTHDCMWDARYLSPDQINYATSGAYISYAIGHSLLT